MSVFDPLRIMRLTARALVIALLGYPSLIHAQGTLRVVSPDGRNAVTVEVRDSALQYAVTRDNKPIIQPSRLGFAFRNAPPIRDSLRILGEQRATVDTTWTQPWGEVSRVRDHHNELRVGL